MKKKIFLAVAGVLGLFTLAGCASDSATIATMKGATITVADFYDNIKSDSNNQSALASMIIYKVFEDNYGDQVTDEEVEEEYNQTKETAEAQGYDFTDYLAQYGYTTESFKELIVQGLAYEKGMEAHLDVTDEDIQAAWEAFHPEVEAQVITVSTEEEAEEVQKALDDGDDFADIAEEKSTFGQTDITFDSTSTALPATVLEAAFSLEDGAVTEAISATDSSTYTTSYYFVKMVKNSDKGDDIEPFRDQIEEIAEQTQLNDSTFVTNTIGEELTEANVKIQDEAFADVLSSYMDTESE